MVAITLISGIVTLLFGLVVFMFPAALRAIVGGYFILIGILQIIGGVL